MSGPEIVLPARGHIIQGDALQSPLRAASVDLIVTSPPYSLDIQYDQEDVPGGIWPLFIRGFARDAYRVSKDGGRLALNVPLDTTKGWRPSYVEAVQACLAAGWTYRSTAIWNNGNTNKSVARGSVDSPSSPHIFARVEMVALFSKGAWRRGPVGLSTLDHDDWLEWTNGHWQFPGETRRWEGHPAPFPEELPRRLVHLLSFVGDVVYDPFSGSGTTARVASSLGRVGIGLDLSRAYCESALRRVRGEPPRKAEKVA